MFQWPSTGRSGYTRGGPVKQPLDGMRVLNGDPPRVVRLSDVRQNADVGAWFLLAPGEGRAPPGRPYNGQ